MMKETFYLAAPQLLSIEASQASRGSEKEHVRWFVSFSPTLHVDQRGCRFISVVGTLHASGPGGGGDATIGALFNLADEVPTDFSSSLKASEATETLYDIAKGHLSPLLRAVDCDQALPRKAPDPQVTELSAAGKPA